MAEGWVGDLMGRYVICEEGRERREEERRGEERREKERRGEG